MKKSNQTKSIVLNVPVFKDQMQRLVAVPEKPGRIVSLVPSQTELLFSLGLEKEVAGITKFCVHPEDWRKRKKIIGGTKNFHVERIQALAPDLIIGNKEENYREGIEALAKDFPVWMSDISTLEDALQMIRSIGSLTGRQEQSESLTQEIKAGFEKPDQLPEVRVLYLIWRKPFMSVGADTFIHDIMRRCGFRNSAADHLRYPELSEEEIRSLNPQFVFLSSEPYPFKEVHIKEIKNLCPEAEVLLVDGEFFSWYGSRLRLAAPYFQRLQQEVRLRAKF